jgi:hypothetical protein
MAEHDYVIANQNGANTRSDLNNALAAIVSNNSKATAPTTTYAYMWWADTANDILKQRNGADSAWISILTLSTGAPLGTLSSSLLSGALPAISGANLTDLPATDAASATYNQGGTGASSRTVENKLQESVSVKDFGAVGDGVTDDSTAIRNAINYASNINGAAASEQRELWFPTGEYIYDGVEITNDEVCIRGERRPNVNSGLTGLESGSIIKGSFHLSGENPQIRNIGIDVYNDTTADGLFLNTYLGSTGGESCIIEDVIVVASPSATAGHATGVEGHANVYINNVEAYGGLYNMALKVENASVNGFNGYSAVIDGLIIKSETGAGTTNNINVSNINISGSASTDNLIRIMSYNANADSISISGFNGSAGDVGILLDNNTATATAINYASISNVNLEEQITHGIYAKGTNGALYQLNLSNISVANASGRIAEFETTTNYLSINGITGSFNSSSTNFDDSILISSNVSSSSISNVLLSKNYSATNLGGIKYNNTATNNQLGSYFCDLHGNIPYDDEYSISVSGTDQSVTVPFRRNNNTVVAKITAAAGTDTINSFSQVINSVLGTDDRRYPAGYIFIIKNDSANNFVVKHNGAGYIYNKGTLDVTLSINETAMWMFSGYQWFEI